MIRTSQILLFSLAIKFLLVPCYYSTDFEVHRNWMAITYHVPIAQWYTDSTSPWTLDYPPLFAWFARSLASVAARIEPAMVSLQRDPYMSNTTRWFMRSSVIGSELLLLATSVIALGRRKPYRHVPLALLVLLSPGLVMLDHVHFQYNGALFGLLLWSIYGLERSSFPWACFASLVFVLLLWSKHLFVTCAPSFLVYLLVQHVFKRGWFDIKRFMALGLIVLVPSALLVLPMPLAPLLTRLFPFARGLCHAYWAPNVWALYASLDRFLSFRHVAPMKLHLPHWLHAPSTSLAGVSLHSVGGCALRILPEPTPLLCAACTLLASLPSLVRLARHPTMPSFLRSLVATNLAAFLFGYHVHEKAAMSFLIPFILLACRGDELALAILAPLSTMVYYTLTPLLFPLHEALLAHVLVLLHHFIMPLLLPPPIATRRPKSSHVLLHLWPKTLPLVALCRLVLPLLAPHLAFLPLLLVSLHGALFFLIMFAFTTF